MAENGMGSQSVSKYKGIQNTLTNFFKQLD